LEINQGNNEAVRSTSQNTTLLLDRHHVLEILCTQFHIWTSQQHKIYLIGFFHIFYLVSSSGPHFLQTQRLLAL